MPMKRVIIVNGPARAGKDTFINICRHLLPIKSTEFSSIDPVRDVLKQFVDISGKTESDRKLLATVGSALEEHSNFRSANCVMRSQKFFESVPAGVFFCHVREPEIIRLLCEAWKMRSITTHTVMLDSNRAARISSNPADAGVFGMDYDHNLRNDGTIDDLWDTARGFLIDLGLLSR